MYTGRAVVSGCGCRSVSKKKLERVKGIEPSSRYTTRFIRFFRDILLQPHFHWGISILTFILILNILTYGEHLETSELEILDGMLHRQRR